MHFVRDALSAIAEHLDSAQFRRIHKSTIVNVDALRELHAWFLSEYRVLLRSGAELKLSRSDKKNVEDLPP